jgi:hypothetical protein
VLDQGLPRLALFRLYGVAREDRGESRVQVVFVGQDGDTGPDDHYLPGEPSPLTVAAQVTGLVSRAGSATAPAGGRAEAAETSPAVSDQPSSEEVLPRADGRAAADSRAPTPRAVESRVESAAPAPRPVAAETGPGTAANGRPAEAVPAGAGAAADAEAQPDSAEPAPKRPRLRLDVVLIRVGLALLILGALLFLIRIEANPPSLPPGAAPATPTRRPTASPKPAAIQDAGGSPVVLMVIRG